MNIVISEKKLTCDSKEFGIISSELLRAGNTIRFTAKGTSMHPLIRDGDIVLIIPLKDEQIRKGDVVLFTIGDGRVLLHRVVEIRRSRRDEECLIQGDHSIHSDGYIPTSKILGSMVAVQRGGLQISTKGLVYRSLGRLISLYLRINPKNSKPYLMLFKVLKQIPLFKQYLS